MATPTDGMLPQVDLDRVMGDVFEQMLSDLLRAGWTRRELRDYTEAILQERERPIGGCGLRPSQELYRRVQHRLSG